MKDDLVKEINSYAKSRFDRLRSYNLVSTLSFLAKSTSHV